MGMVARSPCCQVILPDTSNEILADPLVGSEPTGSGQKPSKLSCPWDGWREFSQFQAGWSRSRRCGPNAGTARVPRCRVGGRPTDRHPDEEHLPSISSTLRSPLLRGLRWLLGVHSVRLRYCRRPGKSESSRDRSDEWSEYPSRRQ